MNAHLSTGVKRICEYLVAHTRSRTGLSQKAMKELLRQTDFAARLEGYRPQGRVCCGEVVELCRPVLERLCPQPPRDWLKESYAQLAHGLFPDPARASVPRPLRQAIGFYVTVLALLLAQEPERCPYDPLTDVCHLTPEELENSLISGEYAAWRQAIDEADFLPLLRIGRECMPFDAASHTIGVHHMALHMGRQAAKAGLPVDLALVSAAALSHDIGKFGCRGADAGRIPFLHYYYTWQWLTDKGLPKIAHISANHSTWDLEFENLTLESLLLIYADFRVRGSRENGREVMRIYSLEDSYAIILSKLCDRTPEKERRYETVYRKLSDFERFLRSYGVSTDPLSAAASPVTPPDAALLEPEQILPAFCNLTFENNVRLMYSITKDVTFAQLLEQARGEKNLHRIRTYLRLFEEYNTYMTGANKRRTLSLLYELLMHHEGDVRRTSARIMGQILANSGPKYRKEVPSGAPQSATAPATAAFLTESVELWQNYMESCLHPDRKISAKHAQRISNSLKIITASLMENCDEAERIHYLEPLLQRLLQAQGEERFILTDTLYYVPLDAISPQWMEHILQCLLRMLPDADEPLQVLILRRLEAVRPRLSDAQLARMQAALAPLAQTDSYAVAYLRNRLGLATPMPDTPVSQLFLSNLKNAVHWMVKLTQVEALCDEAKANPEIAFHTAMHLSNLLSVSEHLPVRERAGRALLEVARTLRVDQQNEIAVDLLRELETGQEEISAYVPRYLGVLMTRLPDKELDECLRFLEGYVRSGNVQCATACLQTLGCLLTVFSHQNQGRRTRRILGLLLSGVAHYNDAIHQAALTVLCENVLANGDIPVETRRHYFLLMGKKLLTLLKEPHPGKFNFFTQAAVMNHVYRFLVDSQVRDGAFPLPEKKPAAFFPGTFDPFSAGHKRIVEQIRQMGFEVYLAIDEFSWSKQPLPKLLRRQIANMSVADQLDVYLFPDQIPVNIASAEDLSRLRALFPRRQLYLVAGSDVIRNASAYQTRTPGSAGDYDHIIFAREESGSVPLELVNQRIRGEKKILSLPAFYETVSSTRIREYVDKNMDISMLVDPMVQNFIYERGLYLRAPQFKQVMKQQELTVRFAPSIPAELTGGQTEAGYSAALRLRSDNRLCGWVCGRTVRASDLWTALGDLQTAEFVRRHTSGRILLVERVHLSGEQAPEHVRLLLTELLVRTLEDDHTYALYLRQPGDDRVVGVLPQLGFCPVPGRSDVYYVDMRAPIVLVQDVMLRFKEPLRSDPAVGQAVEKTRPRLRLALAALFPGKLIASFDAELLNQGLVERVQHCNGVQDVPAGERRLGPYMCVPYGKILAGEVVPNTVTKSLHVDKAYTDDIYHFVIKEYPGYSNLSIQARTVKSFHRPVILVDDLLHKGYRLEKLEAVFRQESLQIHKIIVGILSGRGKDLMAKQGHEVDCQYFIPNLHYWFTESLLYPFIGGDSIDGIPAVEGMLPTANLILPYEYPSYLRGLSQDALAAFSRTALENAAEILQTVETRHQQCFSTALTIRRLAEAFIYPRAPYRGRYTRYDPNATASDYVGDDLHSFRRLYAQQP